MNKLALIDEQTSPLFRIMMVHNYEEPQHRVFENNICAFHIGGGYLLSVAHNLRTEAGLLRSIGNDVYQSSIAHAMNYDQRHIFERAYLLDNNSGKRRLNTNIQPSEIQELSEIINATQFDKRWISLMESGNCTPALVLQFRENAYFGRPDLNHHFAPNNHMQEAVINRFTFLAKLKLVQAWFESDIALYKVEDLPAEALALLPAVDPSFDIVDDNQELFCLQSAPFNELGRMVNRASIDGYLDHFTFVPDRIGGNYIMEGSRYLIKGYFRFGSSGAPYLHYNKTEGRFRVNAIQSEACPIQLAISNNREGNFQYVSALATPLSLIKDDLLAHLKR